MSHRTIALHLVLWALVWSALPAAPQPERPPFSPAAEKLFSKGLKHYTKGQYPKAREAFVDLLKLPLNQRSSAGQLLLGRALFRLEDYERALQVAKRLEQKFPGSRYVADACLLAGDCCYALHRYAEAALLYGRALAMSGPVDVQAGAAERLAGIVGNELITSQAVDRLRLQVGEERLREALLFGQARWYGRLGWEAQSRAALKAYQRRHPGGLFAPLLAERPAGAQAAPPAAEPAGAPPPPRQGGGPSLGALLPVSGPNQQLGRDLLDGIQLANREQGSPLELVVADIGFDYGYLPIAERQGSELVRTGRAMRRLVEDEAVLAVVGPLFSAAAAVAAAGAQTAGMPLIVPLAQQSGLDSLGQYVFQLSAIPEIEGRALGEYATLTLGLETLVVLAPLSDYGWNFEREFTRAAQANGGQVVYRDWYLPDEQKDFKREFEEIRRVGLALRPPPAAADSASAIDSQFVDTIDGVAVVVESFEDARTIAPQLRFYQLRTQVLGNDVWYDPEALSQMSPEERQDMAGCVFISGRDDTAPAAREFDERFRRQYGRQSGYAAYGYDAARLVLEGWAAGKRGRRELGDWLGGVNGFEGASGRISFTQGRRVNSELVMMKIDRRGQIVPVDQAELPGALGKSWELEEEAPVPAGEE